MDTITRAWSPVLSGDLAHRARGRAVEIGEALLDLPHPDAGDDHSLGNGSTGLALVHSWLAEATGAAAHRERATSYVVHAQEAVRTRRTSAALYGGFPGVALAVELLGGGERLAAVDSALVRGLSRSPWRGHFDLISGLAGVGVFALARLHRPDGARLCELVVDRLAESGVARGSGIVWHTPAAWMLPETAADYPQGYDNLGMAHGSPGVIAFLAGCLGRDIATDRARALLDAAVAWVLDQQLDSSGARFPVWRSPGDAPRPSRTAWCYGDPGVAAALLLAGRGAARPDWAELAVEVALEAAARPPDRTGVVDASLCHGAAGLAHVLARMHQLTGVPALADAAHPWYERAIELPVRELDNVGFLTGTGGVALALLAAVEPAEPTWDRTLALSVPTPTAGNHTAVVTAKE
ncbi:MAG: lanthionine synthetase C family protein [Pseudonocardia sp.]|nr:lanthionine synthetase C family protein [Pseudonocardia sp.]